MKKRLILLASMLLASAAFAGMPETPLGMNNQKLLVAQQKKILEGSLSSEEKALLKSYEADKAIIEKNRKALLPGCIDSDQATSSASGGIPNCSSLSAEELGKLPYSYKWHGTEQQSDAEKSAVKDQAAKESATKEPEYRFAISTATRDALEKQITTIHEKWDVKPKVAKQGSGGTQALIAVDSPVTIYEPIIRKNDGKTLEMTGGELLPMRGVVSIKSAEVGTLGAGNQAVNALLIKRAQGGNLNEDETAQLTDFDKDQKQIMGYRDAMRPYCAIVPEGITPTLPDKVPACEGSGTDVMTRAKSPYVSSVFEPWGIAVYRYSISAAQRMNRASQIRDLYKKWNALDPSYTVTINGHVAEGENIYIVNFPLIESAKLQQLAADLTEGKTLTSAQLKALTDAPKDEARLTQLTVGILPVCEVKAKRDNTVDRQTGISLGQMKDCSLLSDEELAKTHEAAFSLETSFGKGGSAVYRYPGTDQEEAARQSEVNTIKNKWKQWESQQ